jgi:L-iditol 2-dehydrogenase
MLATRLVAPGRFEVVDVAVPEPGPGQVLVRMQHASICGSDVHIVFDGMHQPHRLGAPGYPGHEGVGVVVGGDGLPEGTAVLTVPLGPEGACFAEYQAVDARQVIPLPAGGDPRRLLLAQQLGTTVYGMRAFVPGAPPRSVAIIGAGSAGLFFLQQALRLGATTVVVSDLDDGRLATARKLGATDTVRGSLVEAVRDLTGGAGADLVIEAAGYDSCRAEAVEAARERGTLGLFGYPERTGSSPFPVERAFRKSLTMQWINGTQREPGLRSFREAISLIAGGHIAVDHCLECSFPLDRAVEAIAVARDHGHGHAKVGIEIP